MRKLMFMWFLVLSAIFLSFPYVTQAKTKVNLEQEYIPYAYEIMNQLIEEVEEEFGLQCIGSGGRMSRDVDVIKLSFSAVQRATVEEARALEVKCIEKLITMMNTDEKIRPFLRKYPADHENVAMSIAFCKKDNSRYKDGSVSLVFLGRGKIFYRAKNPISNRLVPIIDEPYEEAVKIVQETK